MLENFSASLVAIFPIGSGVFGAGAGVLPAGRGDCNPTGDFECDDFLEAVSGLENGRREAGKLIN